MFLERAIILLFLNLCLDEIINAMILILKKAFFSLIDIVLSPFSLLYLFLLRLVRRFGVPNFPLHRRLFRFIGVFPIIDHYYEPKFVYEKDIVHNEKRLIGIDFNEEVQIAELHSLKYVNELFNLEDKHAAYGFYFNNTAFDAGDADLYYLLIRNRKPKRIIEIGSGFSTKVALKAIAENKAEGFTTKLTCIEPYEMSWLNEHPDIELIRQKLEELPASFFEDLNEGDILFIDSSHMIRPGNDVLVEYLVLLPLLKKGVLVHIHDIFSPRDYPSTWLKDEYRFWNEQYLLEAFLVFNAKFGVKFSVNHLKYTHFQDTAKVLVNLKHHSEPGSFWIERIAD